MTQHYLRQSGYIALLAVLIVGAASLAIASALLLTAADSQRSTLVSQQSAQARSLATACGEEGLQKIFEDSSYTGTTGMIIGCSFTVANLGGGVRQIDANATVGTSIRRISINATIGATNITINTWQEVAP
jgi:hypothetical protein